MPLPLEIIGLHRPDITFVWEDDHRSIFTARDLRLSCRCAMCIEEMTGVPLLDPGKVPKEVVATSMELIGQYAVAIRWSDGHATGIYNFRDLRERCPCLECASRRAKQ
jgi:ATP-binding protein involved in chromosome partitioning